MWRRTTCLTEWGGGQATGAGDDKGMSAAKDDATLAR
jgi:hypothetical protein